MVSILPSINKKLDLLLSQKIILPRPGAGSAIELSLLLPLSILLGRLKLAIWTPHDVAFVSVSVGFLFYNIISILYIKKRNNVLNVWCTIGVVVLLSCASYMWFGSPAFPALIIFSLIFYECLVLAIMKSFPRSFTYGESSIVTEGVIYFLISCMTFSPGNTCVDEATVILQVGFVILMMITLVSYHLKLGSSPILFFTFVGCSLTAVMIPLVRLLLGVDPYKWVWALVFKDQTTVLVLFIWVLCCVAGAGFVVWQVSQGEKASTVARKSFHLLVLLAYFPALVSSPCLLYFASGVAMALLIGIEVVRLAGVGCLGGGLEAGFSVFSDSKDSGGVALTPLYLLAGASLPLWIHPSLDTSPSSLLPLLSGLLTTAVGDSAASVAGSYIGTNKWPGTQKTKEGTVACFLSQLFSLIALTDLGYLSIKELVRPVLAIFVTSLTEAVTDQVDNLVLPLLMYIIVVS